MMKDRVEKKRFFCRDTFKLNFFKVCILTIFIMSVLFFKTIFAYSNEAVVNKISTRILGFSFPNLVAGNFECSSSGFNIFSYDILNLKKDVMKKEISCLKAANYSKGIYPDTYDRVDTEEGEPSVDVKDTPINSFVLNDGSVELKKSESISKMPGEKPRVLIYHTHTGEAYYPIGDDPSRSRDNNYNVCAVGENIKSILEKKYNIKVIHDTTIHDDNYTKSYQKSRETLQKYLSEYGDFDLIIDLHRDSIENKSMAQCTVGNEKAAKFMFVMCTENPNYNKQKKIVDELLKITKEKYPQLLRSNEILTYKKGIGYYSQDLSSKCLLLECGTNLNGVDEALITSKYIADILAKYLITE